MDWKNKTINVNLHLLTTKDEAGGLQGTKPLEKRFLKNSRNNTGKSHIGKSMEMAFIWIIK